MADYEPQIIELEPEKAPRMTAIILLVCGLMGVSFLMVNVFFTGEDPFQSTSWPEEDDGSIQEAGNILPNVWRGRGEDDEEEEVKDNISARKTTKPPTTGPFTIPGYEQFMKRPTIAPPPTTPAIPMPKPVTPPKPGGPGAQPAPTPDTPTPGK
jgi:hypothetical protein